MTAEMDVDKSYAEHRVFGDLDKYAGFYKSLAFSVFGLLTMGTRSACNIDSYLFSSMQGTLESIKVILASGRINDAYALLRKYYDSAIINAYADLYLKDNFSIGNLVVVKIDNWFRGKEGLPEFRVMSEYLRSSASLCRINELLYKNSTTYKDLRQRCNDHTHYNFYDSLLLNDSQVFLPNRLKVLEGFSRDLDDIFILHLAYLFSVSDHYMASSDYVDHLECGMTPPEGSANFVAPFVQDIFDSVIKKKRMDIALEIKNSTVMKLE